MTAHNRWFQIPLLVTLVVSTASAAQVAPAPLFIEASSAQNVSSVATKMTSQQRRVSPDFAVFGRAVARNEYHPGSQMNLNLFPGVAFQGEVTRIETSEAGAISLTLQLRNQPRGAAVITAQGNALYGNVRMPGAVYSMHSLADGTYIVEKLNDANFPPDEPPGEPVTAASPPPTSGSNPGADVPTDTGRLIDVAITWDAAAQSSLSTNAAGMQALAASSVATANSAYANSGIAQRLRLVYSGAVTYTERTSTSASDCYGGTDAFSCALWDANKDLITHPAKLSVTRDQNGADLLSLFIGDTTYCGISDLPTTISSSNSAQYITIVNAGCAVGNLSYPHELGHNMGARHDTYVDNTMNTPYSFNHGYIDLDNEWRTIMAYNNECSDSGFNCTRIAWFSNPDFTVDADGAGGEPPVVMGDASERNNALQLNLSAKAVASYRATSASHPITASFTDVPLGNSQFGAVEFMKQAQISSGCTGTTFCPNDSITRRQMSVFLERAKKNALYSPPAATGKFTDVPADSQFASFVEALANDGITAGCTATTFCPDDPVTRAQMAIFIIRASCGTGYTPAAATGTIFADVSTSTSGAAYIEKLYRMGITGGCTTNPLNYCPAAALTRGQMAVFLERSFPFQTPSFTCSS